VRIAGLEDAIRRFEAGESEGLLLVHGEEDFLVEETGRAVVSRLAPEGGGRDVRVISGGKDEAAAIVAEMASVSLFSRDVLVFARDSELFGEKRERDAEAFLAWLEKTPRLPHPILFTVYDSKGDRGRVDKRRRLYKAVARRGATCEFGEMKPDAARAWAAERFRAAGKEAEAAAVDLLVAQTGVALGVLANEIDKITTYLGGERRVDRGVVERLVGPSREDAVWGLTDTVLSGSAPRALRDLARLIDRSGENPLGILMWLAREFRALLEARVLLDHPRVVGARLPRDPGAIQARFVRVLSTEERAALIDEGFAFLGMHPWAASLRLAAAQRFRASTLRGALLAIARAERLLKSGGGGRPRAVLEETVVALAAGGSSP
jgi:DNA polymerase-3 subunit delta